MNKLVKRALGAALSLTLAAGVLAGCSGPTAAEDPIKDMMGEESGITGDTVMLKVNGSDLTAEDLFFWMNQSASQVASYSQAMGSETVDWTAEAGEGQTMADYVKENAREQAILYHIVAAKAMENGYEFTEEDKAAYEEELTQAKEDLGGEEAYQTWLKSSCITEAGMEKLSSVGVLFNHMKDGMFQDGGEYAPTEEDLLSYAEENDYLCAKHILLMTQDPATGEAMSEEEAAAKKETAQALLDQLKAIQDPAELEKTFDTLMNENSEDTGLAANPDGYTFTAGQMVPEFEEGTRALEFGQVSSELVKSDYGYHIILRLDPSKSESLRSQWATEKLNEMVDQWVEEAEVEETEAFTNLDVGDFYTKLTAWQDSLKPAEEETEQAAEAETELTEEAEAAEEEAAPAEEAPAAETAAPEAEQTEETHVEEVAAQESVPAGSPSEQEESNNDDNSAYALYNKFVDDLKADGIVDRVDDSNAQVDGLWIFYVNDNWNSMTTEQKQELADNILSEIVPWAKGMYDISAPVITIENHSGKVLAETNYSSTAMKLK